VNRKNLNLKNDQALRVENVSFSWNKKSEYVIHNCNLSISKSGLWMVVGKNGCGKSTLFKLLKGILTPTQGCIKRPLQMSIVFQNPDHQILMPTCGSELILNVKPKMSKQNLIEKVDIALKSVGMDGFFKRPIHTLSGGQKQRLAIASALISDSAFLLMDEPTALLDEFSQKQILEIIKNLTISETKPLAVLWITHRLEELEYADKVSIMKEGRLSEWENPHNLKYI